MKINAIDQDALREQVQRATPFPFFMIDDFLEGSFARQVEESFPSFGMALQQGRHFSAVNERNKIQITDPRKFPPPILSLHEALAAPDFVNMLSYVMDIPDLLAEPTMAGGGIHQTGPRGHLDVHVDFNVLRQNLFRRLNILIYFNSDWCPEWGGNVELWDEYVSVCHHSIVPRFNRCVVFATSDISFHGVSAVRCPPEMSRKSFAAYYYTEQPPAGWDGKAHSTIFRARPNEKVKQYITMPLERLSRAARGTWSQCKHSLKRMLSN